MCCDLHKAQQTLFSWLHEDFAPLLSHCSLQTSLAAGPLIFHRKLVNSPDSSSQWKSSIDQAVVLNHVHVRSHWYLRSQVSYFFKVLFLLYLHTKMLIMKMPENKVWVWFPWTCYHTNTNVKTLLTVTCINVALQTNFSDVCAVLATILLLVWNIYFHLFSNVEHCPMQTEAPVPPWITRS